jgi:hypothetical protein
MLTMASIPQPPGNGKPGDLTLWTAGWTTRPTPRCSADFQSVWTPRCAVGWILDISANKSQRDFASKPRVGAQRLPWVDIRCGHNPNGVASGTAHAGAQPWALRRNPVGILPTVRARDYNNLARTKMFQAQAAGWKSDWKSAIRQSVIQPTASSVSLREAPC